MEDLFSRLWAHLQDRITGPMTFRLILQPSMALFFGVRDGLKDARLGKAPYFWKLFTDAASRRDLIQDGWKSVAKVFLMAVLIDAIFQYLVFHWLYPVEALITAAALALLPYLLIRGPVSRFASRRSVLFGKDT